MLFVVCELEMIWHISSSPRRWLMGCRMLAWFLNYNKADGRVSLCVLFVYIYMLQFTQAHQNRTIEDWKNVAWSDESRFLLRHSDGRVRIWRKGHESMNPSCLVSMVQAGGGVMGVGDIFLAHLVPLTSNWALFKRHCCWPCPSLYDYSVPIFWWLLPAG